MVACQHSTPYSILKQRLFCQTTGIVRRKKCSKTNDRSLKLCNYYEESTFLCHNMSFNWSNQFEQKPFNSFIVSFHWIIVWNLFRDLFYKRDLLKSRETTITISLFGSRDPSQWWWSNQKHFDWNYKCWKTCWNLKWKHLVAFV